MPHIATTLLYQCFSNFFDFHLFVNTGDAFVAFFLFHFWNRFPPSFQRHKKKLNSYRSIPGILFCDYASLGHLRNQWRMCGEDVFGLFGNCWSRQEGDARLNIFCIEARFFLSFCWCCDIKWLVFYKRADGTCKSCFDKSLVSFFHWTGVNHSLDCHVFRLRSGLSQHNLLFCDVCVTDVGTMGIIPEIFQLRNAYLISIGFTISARDNIFLL